MSVTIFGTPTYAQLEDGLRTGDIFLYRDPASVIAAPTTTVRMLRASALSYALSLFPCVSSEVVRFALMPVSDGTDDETEDATNCALDFEGDFGDCNQAAIVLRLVDETHTNTDRLPHKMLPYIFTLQSQNIVPLRDFVSAQRLVSNHFRLRQLLILNEEQLAEQQRCSRQRRILEERLLSFFREVNQQAQCAGDTERRQWQIYSFLANDPSAATLDLPSVPRTPPATTIDTEQMILFNANSNYMVLFALFRAGLINKAPHARCAAERLHRDSELILTGEYRLRAPISFTA